MKSSLNRQPYINKAVTVLERFAYLKIPLFLRFDIFDKNMRVLLSKSDLWLSVWDSTSNTIEKLLKTIKSSKPFKKFTWQFKILRTLIISLTIIISALAIYNLIILSTLPIILLGLFLIYYAKDIVADRYIIAPNREGIARMLKVERLNILKLIKLLRSYEARKTI
ncbi:MAG: hypothetical protein QW739_05065 [Candidatus Odinarchaeota archaeon]